MNPLLEAALERAREGALVLPLHSTDAAGVCDCWKKAICSHPGKHPRTQHGLSNASSDPSTIERWWAQFPVANLGVVAGDLPRIDIDDSEIARQLLKDPELCLLTEVVRTRKGIHITLRAPRTATSQLALADGRIIGDVKGVGGYVLVPPSRIGEFTYMRLSPEWVEPLAVENPLVWLRERLASLGHTLADTRERPVYRDVEAGVAEGGRHAALLSHAGLIYVDGIGAAAFAAALHGVNEAICQPPLPHDEVQSIVQHFLERRERRVPTGTVLHDPAMVPADRPRPALSALSLDAWLTGEDEPLDVVIGDHGDGAILPIDGKGFLAGATGIGKTNLLLRLGRCLAEGSAFLGLPIPQPRRVLHIALEGSRRGMRKRLRKVWRDAPDEVRARFFLCQGQFNLSDEADIERLHALVADVRPDVVIIDPLRNAHTWDENSSQEMAQLTGVLDELIGRHHCALVAAHHDRKRPPMTKRDSGTDRIRGSTGLAGWLSFCLSIEKDKLPDTLIAEWTKVRDAEESLSDLVLTFDRETLDFSAAERTAASKVSDDDILTPVFHAGRDGIRGSALVEVVQQRSGAGERTVKDRIRVLAKAGQLIEFIADEDRAKRAKSYRLPEEEE